MGSALKLVWLVALAVLAIAAEGVFPESPVRYAAPVRGVDFGAEVNRLYDNLPPSGGVIIVKRSGSFATPIVFGAKDKPVLLVGLPGDVVTLTYTGLSGTAVTFDVGKGHRMGWGLRDLTLTGPGNATSTIGAVFGGQNGAEGIEFRDFKIQGFGVNLQMGSHTWLARFEHGMIRDGGINLLLPAGLEEAGEQITFDHVTFADGPPPYTNSVWIQGGGQEVTFQSCSFDQAQLRIGNRAVSAAQVSVSSSHWENPDWNWGGATNYSYLVLDEAPGNLVRLTDSYMLQDAPTGGPDHLIEVLGGHLVISGLGLYTPHGSPLQHLAIVGPTATVQDFAFVDLSGNIRGTRYAPVQP